MMLKITPNPDKQKYMSISQMVTDNKGYCPCMIESNEDTKCICKEFRDQNIEGLCHCGRFIKVLI